MMNAAAQQEILEASVESCLRIIAGAEPGKEEQVFAEWSRHAVRHALQIGWDKDAIVDRLDNAGQAIGLEADLRQEILGEAFAVDEIVSGMERREKHNSPPTAPLSTTTPAAWKGTQSIEQRWLAHMRIPSGDLTIGSGNGGAGRPKFSCS